MRRGLLLTTLLLATVTARAGVIIDGTRLVYHGDKKESSIGITNPDAINYLIQSWVDNGKKGLRPPFLITPPLFRLDAKEENILRIVRTDDALPKDRESLYWLNIKSIPSSSRTQNINTLQIAINTRIKLLYRPESVKGNPESVADKLTWHQRGNQLVVDNPTAFYMNFQSIAVDGKKIGNVMFAMPKSESHFALPQNTHGKTIAWSIITDYGSISKTWTASLD